MQKTCLAGTCEFCIRRARLKPGMGGFPLHFWVWVVPPLNKNFPTLLQLTDNRRFARVVSFSVWAGLPPGRFSKRDPGSIPTCWLKKGAAFSGHHFDMLHVQFFTRRIFKIFRKESFGAKERKVFWRGSEANVFKRTKTSKEIVLTNRLQSFWRETEPMRWVMTNSRFPSK